MLLSSWRANKHAELAPDIKSSILMFGFHTKHHRTLLDLLDLLRAGISALAVGSDRSACGHPFNFV